MEHIKDNALENRVSISRLKGKLYWSFGDSITARDGKDYATDFAETEWAGRIGRGFQTIVSERYGTVNSNFGVGGSTILDGYSGILSKNFSTVSLVTTNFGVNDARTGVPMGTLGNYLDTSFDKTTFLGCYRTILDYIVTSNPETRIILITPLQRNANNFSTDTVNANGEKLINFVDAIIRLGEMYSIPVCDMYRESGINVKNLDYYTFDGVHPNDWGYMRMGNLLCDTISKL